MQYYEKLGFSGQVLDFVLAFGISKHVQDILNKCEFKSAENNEETKAIVFNSLEVINNELLLLKTYKKEDVIMLLLKISEDFYSYYWGLRNYRKRLDRKIRYTDASTNRLIGESQTPLIAFKSTILWIENFSLVTDFNFLGKTFNHEIKYVISLLYLYGTFSMVASFVNLDVLTYRDVYLLEDYPYYKIQRRYNLYTNVRIIENSVLDNEELYLAKKDNQVAFYKDFNLDLVNINALMMVIASRGTSYRMKVSQFEIDCRDIMSDDNQIDFPSLVKNFSITPEKLLSERGEKVEYKNDGYFYKLSNFPFLIIGDEVYISSSIIHNTFLSWKQVLLMGKPLGDNSISTNLNDLVEKIRQRYTKQLVSDVYNSICQNYPGFVCQKEVDYKRIFPEFTKRDLGDYDILFYNHMTKIIYNIEVKFFSNSSSIAGSIRKIKRTLNVKDGYLWKFNHRVKAVNKNIDLIKQFLSIPNEDIVCIEHIFLTSSYIDLPIVNIETGIIFLDHSNYILYLNSEFDMEDLQKQFDKILTNKTLDFLEV